MSHDQFVLHFVLHLAGISAVSRAKLNEVRVMSTLQFLNVQKLQERLETIPCWTKFGPDKEVWHTDGFSNNCVNFHLKMLQLFNEVVCRTIYSMKCHCTVIRRMWTSRLRRCLPRIRRRRRRSDCHPRGSSRHCRHRPPQSPCGGAGCAPPL